MRQLSLSVIALTFAWTLHACGDNVQEIATCEASAADCACRVDADCVLTPYALDVAQTMTCKMQKSCCTGGFVRNASAATRNQMHYDQAQCTYLESIDCAACTGPRYRFWAACEKSLCVELGEKIGD